MAVSTYVIPELRDDKRYWRLHWFEELLLNQQTTLPLISARFVPMKDVGWNRANSPALLKNSSYDFDETREISLGVGFLPVFHIGTVFHFGRLVARPRYQLKVFNLFIEKGNTEVVNYSSFRSSTEGSRIYDVPWWEYWLKGTNRFVRCLHVDVPKGRRDGITKLIIPVIEIIRFFYANSSELLREVFTGGLIGCKNRVFDCNQTVLPGGDKRPYIVLSEYVTKEDAPIIARWLFSIYALDCARHIYTSLQTNGTRPFEGGRPQGFLPEVGLPYINEKTKLVVHGKEIRSGDRKFFLAYYVSSDSARFPFSSFDFAQEKSSRPESEPAGVDTSERPENVVTTTSSYADHIIRNDKEVGTNKKRIERVGWLNRFSDLKEKQWFERHINVRKKDPLPTFLQSENPIAEYNTLGLEPVDAAVRPLTVVPNSRDRTDQDTRRLTDNSETYSQALTASMDRFEIYVRALNEIFRGKMRCEFLHVSNNGGLTIHPLPVYSSFPLELKGQSVHWSFRAAGGEKKIPRVMIARGICLGKQYFYLFEIEPHEGCNFRRPRSYMMCLAYWSIFAEIPTYKLRELLFDCAKHQGCWSKALKSGVDGAQKRDALRIQGRVFKHASKSESVFVARILVALSNRGLLEVDEIEKSKISSLQRGKDLIKVPDVTLSVEKRSEIRANYSEGDEVVKTSIETGPVVKGSRTLTQQSFGFDGPESGQGV